jgi:5'-3' exonuclease
MVDIKHPLLFIDLGYAMFYRYSATQTWYKHSHPEEKDQIAKDYKWHQNDVFVEKMKKMFVEDIMNLGKKHKIPKNNIIIAEDCRLKDNWRSELFSDYKAQRGDEREKNGWQGANSFEILYNDVLPEMIKNHNIIHLKYPKVEADDIISQIIISYQNKTKDQSPPKFIIIASDNDYFQILDNNVDLLNMKGGSIKEKMKYSPEGHLIEKILKGDVSDNIDACLFNKKFAHQLIPELKNSKTGKNDTNINPELYIKANKKIIDYYVENTEQLEKDISTVLNHSENGTNVEYVKGYNENKKLIKFTELPSEYVKGILALYTKFTK